MIRGCQGPSDTRRGTGLELAAIGSSIFVILPHSEAALRSGLREALAGRASAFVFERSVDGRIVSFEAHIVGVGDDVIVLIGDVTQRTAAQQQLAATTRILRDTEAELAQREGIAHLGVGTTTSLPAVFSGRMSFIGYWA